MAGRLAGRAFVVTGASRGIGHAIAGRLGADGARLVITAETTAAVRQLPSHLPIGVITSSVITEVEPSLIAAGLRERLSVLICAADVSQHKPHPEPYLTGFERLRVDHGHSELLPASVTVYEDSRSGIASATAAGMTVRPVPDPRDLPTLLSRDGWI